MSERVHSGFARFPNEAERKQFVESVLAEDAALQSRAYVPGSRPTIVFEQLTDGEYDRLRSALVGRGRWFEDVQFDTMPDASNRDES